MKAEFLSAEDKIRYELKSLYLSYGFEEYKLPEFEDYFSVAGASFRRDDRITLNVDGRLRALKSDVTMSVAKNISGADTKKLFYDEKVYRKSPQGVFEVSQLGVEIIGDIDIVCEAEICSLIVKTLSAAGGRFSLNVSHAGIVAKVLSGAGLTGADYDFAAQCLTDKNLHDFISFAERKNLDAEKTALFDRLLTVPSEPDAALKKLSEISEALDLSAEIKEVERICSLCGDCAKINFSASGAAYYNGVVFKGFVEGIPRAVLSGGRYDKLLGDFGKRANAIGFALYLGGLCKFAEIDGTDCEIIYYDDEAALSALKEADILRAQGKKVLLKRGPAA